ncbi:transcriptional regulator (plasmid) [Bradyrhizobium sp. 62B]|uniref:MarR family winged helix-turn-helix transcriptional regulator n=1 Tax=Bradyrhizobium sp. 62B TaxID=2898442 RepID=UPI0025582CCB|nr:transcriptional regulator [Bradyrhizobium sp. 62B]
MDDMWIAGRRDMQVKEQLERALNGLIWNVVEVQSQLEAIHESWAELLGVTQSQWLMLMAVDELDDGSGVCATSVANKLRIHPAYVTHQANQLKRMELLSGQPSADHARYLRVRLTHKARTTLRKLSVKRDALNSAMLDGFDEETLCYLNERLALFAKNGRLASQKLRIGIL